MPAAWSKKRERQYDHIKEGLREHGRSEAVAEEIAARTVNKARALLTALEIAHRGEDPADGRAKK